MLYITILKSLISMLSKVWVIWGRTGVVVICFFVGFFFYPEMEGTFKRYLKSIVARLSQVPARLSKGTWQPGSSHPAFPTELWGTALPIEKAQVWSITWCLCTNMELHKVLGCRGPVERAYIHTDAVTSVSLHICTIKVFLNSFFLSESTKGKRSFIYLALWN